jgi:hypothetical protein
MQDILLTELWKIHAADDDDDDDYYYYYYYYYSARFKKNMLTKNLMPGT